MNRLILVMMIAAGAGRAAYADDNASARAEVVNNIRKNLGRMNDDLRSFSDSSSTDGVRSALDQAKELSDNLSKLDRVKGDDSEANNMVSRYPGYVDAFRSSGAALMALKQAQLAEDNRKIMERCTELDATLRKDVTEYLKTPDADLGAEWMAQLALEARDKIHNDYDNLVNQAGEVQRAYGEARRFSVSDGDWSNITSRMVDAADGIWSVRYQPRLDKTRKECAALDLGRQNPFIVDAMKKLGDTAETDKQKLEALKKDVGAWRDLKREDANKYVNHATKIRMAICDGDEEQLAQGASDAADAARSALSGSYTELLKQLDELIARSSIVADSEKKGKVRTEAVELRASLRGTRTRLVNLMENGGMLMGANNPKIRARIEIGKEKHKSMQDRCDTKEVQLSSGKRIDCVNRANGTCRIIEIKPNNDAAVSRGWEQVKGYQSEVEDMFEHRDSKLHDVFLDCVDRDTKELKLEIDVQTYPFCPVPETDLDAMIEDQIKASSSSSAE